MICHTTTTARGTDGGGYGGQVSNDDDGGHSARMAVTETASDTTALAVVFVWSCLCRGRAADAHARARAPPHPYQTRRNDVATPRTACEPRRCRSGCAIVARAGRVGGGVVGDDHARARTRSSGSDSGVPFSRPLPTGRRCRHLTSVGPPPPPPPRPSSRSPSLSNYKTFTDHEPTTRRPSDGGGGRAVRDGGGITTPCTVKAQGAVFLLLRRSLRSQLRVGMRRRCFVALGAGRSSFFRFSVSCSGVCTRSGLFPPPP